MALVPFPPTSATFLALCAKPEAFAGMQASGAIDSSLRAEGDRAVTVALSDRIPVGAVVTQVDEGFQLAVIQCAARTLMGSRGYNRQAGADEEIVKLAERADAYIDSMGPGAGGTDGKRVTPGYIIGGSTPPVVDAIVVTSHKHADWRALPRHMQGPPRRCW
jgi:hypothetical protein